MSEQPRIVVRRDGGMIVVGRPVDEVLVVEVPAWAVRAIREYREPTDEEILAAMASVSIGGRA